MQEPKSEHSQFSATLRAVDACIERFPDGCTDKADQYKPLLQAIEGLEYEGSILGKANSYQVNLHLDGKLHEQLCSSGLKCSSTPGLDIPREVARAVGQKADLLVQIPVTGNRIVVEIEKANREKILRDVVKMLLFFDADQADLAALVCPRNYVHNGGVWNLFETAHQVLRAFIRVTGLPESKANRVALIGFTQQIFLEGKWTAWNESTRTQFQERARKHFESTTKPSVTTAVD